MDDVGNSTVMFVLAAFLAAALAELAIRRWLVSAILGSAVGAALFVWQFGFSTASEMILPLLFSIIPAFFGAATTALIIKRKGLS